MPNAAPEAPRAKLRLIDNWHRRAPRLWTIQVSILLMLVTGAVAGLAAFTDLINPYLFLGLNVAGYGLIALLRLVSQGDEQ